MSAINSKKVYRFEYHNDVALIVGAKNKNMKKRFFYFVFRYIFERKLNLFGNLAYFFYPGPYIFIFDGIRRLCVVLFFYLQSYLRNGTWFSENGENEFLLLNCFRAG